MATDANYDSNRLHQVCDDRGNLQLVTPRRYGPAKGTGHREQTAGRLRSIALTENPYPAFAEQLRKDRVEIELGGWAEWLAVVGANPPAGAPVGPGETRPRQAQTLRKINDLRRVMHKAVTLRAS